ncbi:MAG: tRNA-binding protein [Acidimicrobiales bacterium]
MANHTIDPDDLPYEPSKLPRKRDITGPDFFALDMRVGEVVAARPFPEARKPAYQLEVDFGPVVGVLRTSAQITNYPLDELVGRQVVGAINLGIRRVAGFESQFLVLGALAPDGSVHLMSPDTTVPLGAPVA